MKSENPDLREQDRGLYHQPERTRSMSEQILQTTLRGCN